MHLSTITLTNVRQFETRTFKFKPGFNLLVGENGAGKSTILRGVLSALGEKQSVKRHGLADNDIRLEANCASVIALVEQPDGDSAEFYFEKRLGHPLSRLPYEFGKPLVLFYTSLESTCTPMQEKKTVASRDYQARYVRRDEEFLYRISRGKKPPGQFNDTNERSFGSSHSVRRFVGEVLSKFSENFKDFYWRLEPYDCTLLPPEDDPHPGIVNVDLHRQAKAVAMRYFLEQHSKRSQLLNWPDEPKVIVSRDSSFDQKRGYQLPDLREIWSELTLQSEDWNYLYACRLEVKLTPRIMIRRDVGMLSLSQLSDGEQRLFSLFVDIARQLHLKSPQNRIGVGEAIVVIDEIDVHLHPKWQRTIVPALEDLFRGCQFIATTHSPFVIQATNRQKVVSIDSSDPNIHFDGGNSIEDIVEDIQGIKLPQQSVRARKLGSAAEKYFTLLSRMKSNPKSVKKLDLKKAEVDYRNASEAFTSDPAVHALLKIQLMEAGIK